VLWIYFEPINRAVLQNSWVTVSFTIQ